MDNHIIPLAERARVVPIAVMSILCAERKWRVRGFLLLQFGLALRSTVPDVDSLVYVERYANGMPEVYGPFAKSARRKEICCVRLVNFRRGSRIEFGVERNGSVLSLRAAGLAHDLDFFSGGESALAAAHSLLATADAETYPLTDVQRLSPVLKPSKILCVGLNYRDHAVESKMQIPDVPTIFLKLPNAVIGPDAEIVLPANSSQPDYEAEFAAVIGMGGKSIPAERWREHVVGYTIMNDVSARDVQLATSQWTLGKSYDTFAPIGPAIVTQDEIPDPQALDIQLSIDGEVLQHSNTRELIFKLPELIAHLSAVVPLEPGDVISTGTPAGVGLGRTPHRWLKSGEEIVIRIQGIGELRNRTVAAKHPAG